MTTYRVIMSRELLEQIESDASRLPSGFRIIGRLGQVPGRSGESPSYRSFYVEVEDDGAPAEMEGCLVEPTFSVFAKPGLKSEVLITERFVVQRPGAGTEEQQQEDGRG